MATTQQRGEDKGEGLQEGVHATLGFGGGVRGAAGGNEEGKRAAAREAKQGGATGHSCGGVTGSRGGREELGVGVGVW